MSSSHTRPCWIPRLLRSRWRPSHGGARERCRSWPASSPAALSACRDLIFEAIQEPLNLASSYALSAREVAFRGSAATLEIHLHQLRLCVLNAISTDKEQLQ